jgi:glycosyltransferase involved in cell wall biosynthesis
MHRDLVVWLPAVNPYLTERFNALQHQGVNFELWINRWRDPSRSWVVDLDRIEFPLRQVVTLGRGPIRLGAPIRSWIRAQPTAFLTFHHLFELMPAHLQKLSFGRHLAFYIEKTFATKRASRLKESAKRLILRQADSILTPGFEAEQYAGQYGNPRSGFHRLDHAVDLQRFERALEARRGLQSFERRRAFGLQGHVFLYVGRVETQKGVWDLLEAYRRIGAAGRRSSLVIVGDGSEWREVERVATRLDGRVIIVPFVQQESIADWYALGDSLVFPSHGDTYGIVVNEAMAAGLPVISSDAVGEIKDRLRPDRGLVFPSKNIDALARCMFRLSTKPESSISMGLQGYRYAQTNLGIDRWVQQLTLWLEEARRNGKR